jgi:hypothetical protein
VLDRAVTLCVKFFVPFATIYVVYAIPLAVVTFFATKDLQTVLQSLSDVAQRGAATGHAANQAEILRTLARGGGVNAWTAPLVGMALLVAPLPAAALVEATAATYLGRPPTFAHAYAVALARWLPLIGVNAIYLVLGVLLYLVVGLAGAFLVFALAYATLALHALGVALDVVVGVAFTLSALAFAIVVFLALQISCFTCVVERANPVTAFKKGIGRVFFGVGLKRSLLVGVAFVAIGIAIAAVSAVGQSLLVGLLHSAVAGAIYSTILSIATAAFTTAFVAIFYFDLRVREEGLDLTLAAQSARADDDAT